MIDVDIQFYQIEHRTHNILLLQEASVKVIFRMMEIIGDNVWSQWTGKNGIRVRVSGQGPRVSEVALKM